MNLYHVTLWDPNAKVQGVKTGANTWLSIVADNAESALREAKRYKGEITNFKLQQSGLIVV